MLAVLARIQPLGIRRRHARHAPFGHRSEVWMRRFTTLAAITYGLLTAADVSSTFSSANPTRAADAERPEHLREFAPGDPAAPKIALLRVPRPRRTRRGRELRRAQNRPRSSCGAANSGAAPPRGSPPGEMPPPDDDARPLHEASSATAFCRLDADRRRIPRLRRSRTAATPALRPLTASEPGRVRQHRPRRVRRRVSTRARRSGSPIERRRRGVRQPRRLSRIVPRTDR